jgi:hypothetical protein
VHLAGVEWWEAKLLAIVPPPLLLLPWQAVTSTMQFPPELTLKALNRSVHEQCDIINLSMGGFHVMPNNKMRSGMQRVAAAGVLLTAAAGNDDQAPVWGPRLFNVASPATFRTAFAGGLQHLCCCSRCNMLLSVLSLSFSQDVTDWYFPPGPPETLAITAQQVQLPPSRLALVNLPAMHVQL